MVEVSKEREVRKKKFDNKKVMVEDIKRHVSEAPGV